MSISKDNGKNAPKSSTLPEPLSTLPEPLSTLPEPLSTLAESADGSAPVHITVPMTDSFRRGDTMLGIYRVESDPIPGGMGVVWRVHHADWDIDLAVKRPKPEYFRTEKDKKSFTEECRNWINLGLHPNIVSCYYVREIEGVPAVFSEWMEGGTLESSVQNRSLYRGLEEDVHERLLDLAIQTARGLGYAHEKGLIHQDVKPDNVLLTRTGIAKVSDFGLAKARTFLTQAPAKDEPADEVDDELLLTDADATQIVPAGGRTPAYCSPEQAAGLPLSRRTDIYSWAVSIMELYLGGKPWARGRELTGPIAGAACLDYFAMCPAQRSVPDDLQILLAECMETNPDDRPRDFFTVEKELIRIYEEVTGKPYTRPAPSAVSDTSDSLNNRALTCLDLGDPEKAEELWEQAIALEPDNLNVFVNQNLFLWRTGKITDLEIMDRVEQKRFNPESSEILRQICLERGSEERTITYPDAIRGMDGIPHPGKVAAACLDDGILSFAIRESFKDRLMYVIRRYRAKTGEFVGQYPPEGQERAIPVSLRERCCTLAMGGKRLILVNAGQRKTELWDTVSQELIREYPGPASGFVTRNVVDKTWFPALLSEKRSDKTFGIFSMKTGTCRACFQEGYAVILPDDKVFVFDKNVSILFDLREKEVVQTVPLKNGHGASVFSSSLGNCYASHNEDCFLYRDGSMIPAEEAGLPEDLEITLMKENNSRNTKAVLQVREIQSRRILQQMELPPLDTPLSSCKTHPDLLTDPDGRCLILYPERSDPSLTWYILPMPEKPSYRMPYRVSFPSATDKLSEIEKESSACLASFDTARRQNDLDGMIRAYNTLLTLPAMAGQDLIAKMNAALFPLREPSGLRGIHKYNTRPKDEEPNLSDLWWKLLVYKGSGHRCRRGNETLFIYIDKSHVSPYYENVIEQQKAIRETSSFKIVTRGEDGSRTHRTVPIEKKDRWLDWIKGTSDDGRYVLLSLGIRRKDADTKTGEKPGKISMNDPLYQEYMLMEREFMWMDTVTGKTKIIRKKTGIDVFNYLLSCSEPFVYYWEKGAREIHIFDVLQETERILPLPPEAVGRGNGLQEAALSRDGRRLMAVTNTAEDETCLSIREHSTATWTIVRKWHFSAHSVLPDKNLRFFLLNTDTDLQLYREDREECLWSMANKNLRQLSEKDVHGFSCDNCFLVDQDEKPLFVLEWEYS